MRKEVGGKPKSQGTEDEIGKNIRRIDTTENTVRNIENSNEKRKKIKKDLKGNNKYIEDR